MHRKKPKATSLRVYLLAAVLVLAAVVIILPKIGSSSDPSSRTNASESGTLETAALTYTCTAHFVTPDKDIVKTRKDLEEPKAVIDLPEAPEYDGYIFIGWQDASGAFLTDAVEVEGEAYFAAVYNVRMLPDKDNPTPFLQLSDDGFFFPDRPVTRGEAAVVIADMLALSAGSETQFTDIPNTSPYASATSALLQLGAVEEGAFRPDDQITSTELIKILSAFAPVYSSADNPFENISSEDEYYDCWLRAYGRGWVDEDITPNEPMTRLSFADVICRVKQRGCGEDIDRSSAGGIKDVPADTYAYAVAAEAAVPHSVATENGVTVWQADETLPVYEPGFQMSGTTLYYFDENGVATVDTVVQDDFIIDVNGHYTSGNKELDEEVRKYLLELEINDDMQPEEKLRAIFCSIAYEKAFFYCKGDVFDPGSTDWAIPQAYQILSERRGNCYGFAAAFWALSRSVGFDCRVISGYYASGRKTEHAWNEIDYIEADGVVTYLFDPELQWNLYTYEGNFDGRWKMPLRKLRYCAYIYPMTEADSLE